MREQIDAVSAPHHEEPGVAIDVRLAQLDEVRVAQGDQAREPRLEAVATLRVRPEDLDCDGRAALVCVVDAPGRPLPGARERREAGAESSERREVLGVGGGVEAGWRGGAGRVTLDIITNVLIFVLATMPAVFTASVDVEPPAFARGGQASLQLSMLVTAAGVSLKTVDGAIGAGCAPGAGVTVPRLADGRQDWAGLRGCAEKIKAGGAAGASDASVRLMADPGTSYQEVIEAMDAVRQTDAGVPLFSEVNFAVAR